MKLYAALITLEDDVDLRDLGAFARLTDERTLFIPMFNFSNAVSAKEEVCEVIDEMFAAGVAVCRESHERRF